ncbi:MAG: hypothetical protein K1060chlam1_00372 [Candidatus Anoxychlamydiales bacterium]|nr:hypothetical protein [Candidatus Anoxychlamydiales bacterium]
MIITIIDVIVALSIKKTTRVINMSSLSNNHIPAIFPVPSYVQHIKCGGIFDAKDIQTRFKTNTLIKQLTIFCSSCFRKASKRDFILIAPQEDAALPLKRIAAICSEKLEKLAKQGDGEKRAKIG